MRAECMSRRTRLGQRSIGVLSDERGLCGARRVGVNGRLIWWLASAADRPALQAQIAEVLQVTGAFSISGALK